MAATKIFYQCILDGEFENTLFTLCFTDTETYYINSPNGQDSCHYQVPVGIGNISSQQDKFYPNPITDNLHIETSTYPSQLYLYNITGKLLLTKDIRQENTRIDFSTYPDGIYFIELKQNNRISRKKVIK